MVAGDTEDTALGRARARLPESQEPERVEPERADREALAIDAQPSSDDATLLEPSASDARDDRTDGMAQPPLPSFAEQAGSSAATESGSELAGEEPGFASPSLPLIAHAAEREGRPLLQRVLQVLLLADALEQAELLALLHGDSLQVTCLSTVTEVIDSVRADAPDLVLADELLARAGGLVAALRTDAAADASTDFVPIVLFENELSTPESDEIDGALELLNVSPDAPEARVPRPFSAAQLVRALGRATGTLVEPAEPEPVGAVTLDELVDRLSSELRKGLVEGALRGRRERVELGEGTDVMATAFGAVAALRALVQRESHGRVEFEPRGRNGVPSLVVPEADGKSRDDQPLHGRRVILAEADTAIALLLANTLREHGATVSEYTDGAEAYEAARCERPALVITGSHLPGLDGLALSRALARDPLLADVPVLLLPPKAQLLAREPSGSASLSPELARQVVHSASDLLTPRRQLEARLQEPGELRGSLEGMGVIALLRSVRRARPDARVRIRDAWNLYECELRDGKLAQVTRTASDGSFVRNERALPHLLGVCAGRFAVIEDKSPMKQMLEGTLDEVLMRGARDLGGELDAVSGASLPRVARVVFDEDAYGSLIGQTPPRVRQVLEALYGGASPNTVLASGIVDVTTLESLLVDLARRGALRGVVGFGGEDLVAEARKARALVAPAELGRALSVVPPAPNPVISLLPEAAPAPLADVPGVVELRAPQPEPREESGSHARVTPVRAREVLSDQSELAAAAAEARRSRSTLVAWTVALLGLVAVALVAGREVEMGGAMPEALGGAPPAPVERPVPALTPRQKGSSLLSAEDSGFAVYDGILDPSVAVAPDQALLMVEATPALAGAVVFVNDRELGAPPQKLALPEGVHELATKRGDTISYRFVAVHPGRTWVLRNP